MGLTIETIKNGDKFFVHNNKDVKWYTYFSPHPINKGYHILIDKNMEPIRFWEEELRNDLLNSYESYGSCARGLATRMSQYADEFWDRHAEALDIANKLNFSERNKLDGFMTAVFNTLENYNFKQAELLLRTCMYAPDQIVASAVRLGKNYEEFFVLLKATF